MAFPTLAVTPGTGQTINTLPNAGQTTAAGSLSVVLASDQAAVPITGTFWQTTQPVSGTVSISGAVGVTGTFWQATQPVSLAAVPALIAGTAIIGKVGIDQTTDGTTNKVSIDASLKSGTATASTAAMTTTSAAALASNANRKGATIYNPNAGALLLNMANGNAATAPHYRLAQYASLEVPSGFTGAITGALESGSGNANVVEFS